MKNIHVLATEKPSRLCIDNSCNELNYSEIEGLSSKHITNQHIYITSDKEIKEGDWIINTANNFISFASEEDKDLNNFSNIKKIILTTDQDLIADGVQAIPDEFLEWFVQNPSCEKVELKKGFADGTAWGYNFLDYKIIIPKESKQEALEEYAYKNPVYSREEVLELLQKSFPDKAISGVFNISASKQIYSFEQSLRELGKSNAEKIMKQETLEEAAEKWCKKNNCGYGGLISDSFENGAKWQQERMYSEEEVLELLRKAHFVEQNIDDWFQTYKKDKI